MTDQPRFQHTTGAFEDVYPKHHGGRLVALVLRLVSRKSRTRGTTEGAPSPPAQHDPMQALDRVLLGDLMSRDFLVASARTQGLQAMVLIAFALFLVGLMFTSPALRKDTQFADGDRPGVGLDIAP